MNKTKASDYPDQIYIVWEEQEYPAAGKQFVGGRYLSTLIPHGKSVVGVYKLIAVETHEKRTTTSTTVDLVDRTEKP